MEKNLRRAKSLTPPVIHFWVHRFLFAICTSVLAPMVAAQPCPSGNAALEHVRNVINDLGKNNQAPAAADCGFAWAAGIALDPNSLTEKVLISFFIEAADLHRRAAEKRFSENLENQADKYLINEITLRRRFIEQALKVDSSTSEYSSLRRAIVRHLSSLTGAWARRKQYIEIDDMLSNTQVSVIDTEAVNAWLQAVSSCDKFDGNPNINLCVVEKRNYCRDRISIFLSSIDEMKWQEFPPRTKKEITGLRRLTTDGGCLHD
ncbi:MAG: hypothetical protein E2602_05920 [Achromobacter sp.]|nr:hypothetical protein [Achromobacter sp.]